MSARRKKVRKNKYKAKKPVKTKKKRSVSVKSPLLIKSISFFILVAFVSILFVFGYNAITNSKSFILEEIKVSGNNKIPRPEIVAQAKIMPGMSTLRINLSLTRKRILAHPWVSEVAIVRELPSRIIITVEEHKAIAVLDLGRDFLLNSRGEVFKSSLPGEKGNLPVVRGLEVEDLKEKKNPRFSAVMEVLKLGKINSSIVPSDIIEEIKVDKELGLTITANEKCREIRIGLSNFRSKYSRIKEITDYLAENRDIRFLDSIDLNDINRVVVKPGSN